jgi:methionine synthase II (cobalamin-independent)
MRFPRFGSLRILRAFRAWHKSAARAALRRLGSVRRCGKIGWRAGQRAPNIATKLRCFSGCIIDYVLQVNAGSFSFEAANPRHEHEYHLFERVKVPEGKVLCPGVITHASNIVEHPELIVERLVRYANLVGRENVMAGADYGFSSQALDKTEVHHTEVWENFKAMRQGADLASRQLWR